MENSFLANLEKNNLIEAEKQLRNALANKLLESLAQKKIAVAESMGFFAEEDGDDEKEKQDNELSDTDGEKSFDEPKKAKQVEEKDPADIKDEDPKGDDDSAEDDENLDEATNAWKVHHNGKHIDTVFSTENDPVEMKKSLVNHDGYHHDIKVTKQRKSGKKAQTESLVDARIDVLREAASRKDFEAHAADLKAHKKIMGPQAHASMVSSAIERYKKENPRFDAHRFGKAAGLHD